MTAFLAPATTVPGAALTGDASSSDAAAPDATRATTTAIRCLRSNVAKGRLETSLGAAVSDRVKCNDRKLLRLDREYKQTDTGPG
jgi:hypothetical protein